MHCVGWRCDIQIFSAQINGHKKEMRKEACRSATIGTAGPVSPFSGHLKCVHECVRERAKDRD